MNCTHAAAKIYISEFIMERMMNSFRITTPI